MEFEQQAGGEATGDASCHEQIADPGEQRRRIGGGCQALFEGLQLLHVAAAPQGIDQTVLCKDVLQLCCPGYGTPRSYLFMASDDVVCHLGNHKNAICLSGVRSWLPLKS